MATNPHGMARPCSTSKGVDLSDGALASDVRGGATVSQGYCKLVTWPQPGHNQGEPGWKLAMDEAMDQRKRDGSSSRMGRVDDI